MLLNRFETLLVNNPVRDRLLDWTVRDLLDTQVPSLDAGPSRLGRVLEIGCGLGAGIEAIRRYARRAGSSAHDLSIDAFDLDPAQIERARERLRTPATERSAPRLWVGDAEHIDAPDARYDTVFEFTIFHHIPDWPKALREVARVLRPGGYFLFEELSREFFFRTGPLGWALRRYTDHPWEPMFDWPAFARGLQDAGLRLLSHKPQPVPGWHRGIAQRSPSAA